MKKIKAILNFVLNKLHIHLTKQKLSALTQFIGFGLVGVSNTAISYFTYLILINFGVYYILASVIGFFVSVTNSFFWNNRYVFKKEDGEKRSPIKAYIKTVLSYALTGLLLGNTLLYIGVSIIHWSRVVVPLLSLIITVPLNFLINKLWTFKNKSRGLNYELYDMRQFKH